MPSQSVFFCPGVVAGVPEHAKILGFRDEVRGDYAHALGQSRAVKGATVGTLGIMKTQ